LEPLLAYPLWGTVTENRARETKLHTVLTEREFNVVMISLNKCYQLVVVR